MNTAYLLRRQYSRQYTACGFNQCYIYRGKRALKAISILYPWGNMIANGEKNLEIRSWHPDTLPLKNIALVQNNIRLTKEINNDPDGQIIAIIDIISSRPWKKEDCKKSGCEESQFSEGFLAWEIKNVRKLTQPIKAVAKRRFYDLSEIERNNLKLVVDKEVITEIYQFMY